MFFLTIASAYMAFDYNVERITLNLCFALVWAVLANSARKGSH
jgi:hypothetical protein